LRVQYQVTHLNHVRNWVSAEILYEGAAPQASDARAFFIPLTRQDGTERYLVVAFEVENTATPTPAAFFGPVIEREIAIGDRDDSFYSFDTGGYVAPPRDFDPTTHSEADTQKLWKWLTDHHADLFVKRNDGQPILAMSDMVIAVIDEKDFDRLTPERLAENEVWRGALAAQSRPSEQSVLKGAGDGKITVAFQTRYNVAGMLQMIGIDSDTPGVKIRYKLEKK